MKIAHQAYLDFKKKFNAGQFRDQRLGQAFENHFGYIINCHGLDANPDCLFQKDGKEAESAIIQNHIDWEK